MEPAQLRFPLGGKPMLTGGPWFSVSHSGNRVAAALSDRGDVGLDLEDAPVGDAAADPETTASLGRWTATEAVLKAVGAGIRSAGDVRLSADRSVAQLDGEVNVPASAGARRGLRRVPGDPGGGVRGEHRAGGCPVVVRDLTYGARLASAARACACSACSRAAISTCSLRESFGIDAARNLHRLAVGDHDATEGQRQLEAVPGPEAQVREAATLIGRIGLPVSCDSSTAPGLNSCTGPRGPSGVIAGEISCLTMVS